MYIFMKKTRIMGAAALLLLTASCEKEKFDQNIWNQFVDYQFLIDNVDREHDWRLTHSDTVTIVTKKGQYWTVEVLTQNPYTTKSPEIAAKGLLFTNREQDGYAATLAYTLPIDQQQAYVGIRNEDGQYIGIVPFTMGSDTVNLDLASITHNGTLTEPQPQTFTYLYEEGFPMPGDFDYNDMVLRVSKSATDVSYVVDLKVTLEAVGASKSYAGAILLAGVRYDDVVKVDILEGSRMDKDYPLLRLNIDNDKTLLRSRQGEAVINLFESAHYVLNNKLDEMGSIQTLYYNTEPTETEGTSAKVEPVTRTYRITFANRETARLLTFEQIDPFIIQEFNGGLWEIHTYNYKFKESLKNIYDGKESFYDNHISWAIVVPKSDFRYTAEGTPLSSFQSDTGGTFGPYEAFSEWIKNHNSHHDWYVTPTRPQLLY